MTHPSFYKHILCTVVLTVTSSGCLNLYLNPWELLTISAVYICKAEKSNKDGVEVIDTDKFPGSVGVTWELCAGIVDKNKSLAEIAQEEILEECGYNVPLEKVERIAAFRLDICFV